MRDVVGLTAPCKSLSGLMAHLNSVFKLKLQRKKQELEAQAREQLAAPEAACA